MFGAQVFFLENDDQHSCLSDPADHSRLTEHIAKAFCLALCPHLKLLKEDGMTKLGLRVTLDSDQVRRVLGTFEAGCGVCAYFLTCELSCVFPEFHSLDLGPDQIQDSGLPSFSNTQAVLLGQTL